MLIQISPNPNKSFTSFFICHYNRSNRFCLTVTDTHKMGISYDVFSKLWALLELRTQAELVIISVTKFKFSVCSTKLCSSCNR